MNEPDLTDEWHSTPFTKLCKSGQFDMVSDFVDFLQDRSTSEPMT